MGKSHVLLALPLCFAQCVQQVLDSRCSGNSIFKKKYIYIYIYIYIGCALILRLGLPFLSHLKKMDSGTLWTENESGDIAASLIMTIAADFARPETV